MCGIVGIVSLSNKKLTKVNDRINMMTSMLKHRGPDDKGVYVSKDGCVALGHTRLAIVDPCSTINQPLQSSDNTKHITFNGEIYNHNRLREKLIQNKVTFQSHTDTEVLFEGLNSEGLEFINQLEGMWAFGYYDSIKNVVTLSRDLMGERPLFYYYDENEFIFASEVKPILEVAFSKFEIDEEAVTSSILFASAPPGKTIIKNVYRLNPGNIIDINVGKGFEEKEFLKLNPEKWFEFFQHNPSEEEVMQKYEELLLETVEDRIPSEVPYNMTLSGGIDSTLNTIFASKTGKRIDTLYAQSTDEPPKLAGDTLSEKEASRLTSQKLNTNHTEIQIANEDSIDVLQNMAKNSFDGLFDPGVVSFAMLAKKTQEENKKVLILSDGPDELFGGYGVDLNGYKLDLLYEKSKSLFYLLQQASYTRAGRVIMRLLGKEKSIVPDIFNYKPLGFKPIHYVISKKYLEELTKQKVDLTKLLYGTFPQKYNQLIDKLDYSQQRALSYANYSLPDIFNLRTDKAFLSESIECRVPHQSIKLVEFAIALPAKYRFNNGNSTKYLPRKVVEKYIGKQVSHRLKYGFSAPLWKNKKVAQKLDMKGYLSNFDKEMPLFNAEAIQEIVKNKRYSKFVWPVYCLLNTYESLLEINKRKSQEGTNNG